MLKTKKSKFIISIVVLFSLFLSYNFFNHKIITERKAYASTKLFSKDNLAENINSLRNIKLSQKEFEERMLLVKNAYKEAAYIILENEKEAEESAIMSVLTAYAEIPEIEKLNSLIDQELKKADLSDFANFYRISAQITKNFLIEKNLYTDNLEKDIKNYRQKENINTLSNRGTIKGNLDILNSKDSEKLSQKEYMEVLSEFRDMRVAKHSDQNNISLNTILRDENNNIIIEDKEKAEIIEMYIIMRYTNEGFRQYSNILFDSQKSEKEKVDFLKEKGLLPWDVSKYTKLS